MMVWLPLLVSSVLSLSGTDPRPATNDASIPYGALLTEPSRRVRTVDARIAHLIEQGVKRSVTFGDLIAAVNASDVIVYIQRVERLAPSVAGQLMIVPVPNAQRYLRIQLLDHLSPDDTIALIAHELRHVLEVAAAPDVRDQKGLAALYERIGQPGGMTHSFDTRAAQNTGRRVKRELVG